MAAENTTATRKSNVVIRTDWFKVEVPSSFLFFKRGQVSCSIIWAQCWILEFKKEKKRQKMGILENKTALWDKNSSVLSLLSIDITCWIENASMHQRHTWRRREPTHKKPRERWQETKSRLVSLSKLIGHYFQRKQHFQSTCRWGRSVCPAFFPPKRIFIIRRVGSFLKSWLYNSPTPAVWSVATRFIVLCCCLLHSLRTDIYAFSSKVRQESRAAMAKKRILTTGEVESTQQWW